MNPASTSRPRAREANVITGTLPTGPLNAITDVAGVLVGHVTLHQDEPPVHTGVTVIIPHPGDTFNEKLVAAVHTINGFGKATGFEQIRELGTLETPIALTNTLCVGRAWDGLVTWMLARHPEIGSSGPSVNPVVGECNDSRLNDLRGRHITYDHVLQALQSARSGPVEEGAVGAGAGMMCYGFKGGVGTASRLVGDYRLGVLLVANFGQKSQLVINGIPIGQRLKDRHVQSAEKGSVMIVLATDAPLTSRQLERIARRPALGLARTGSIVGSGSGDFVIAFSTAQRIPQSSAAPILDLSCLHESRLDAFFQAAVEATEEAVLNALFKAVTITGRDGFVAEALPLDSFKIAS